jgi:hypothetical protein
MDKHATPPGPHARFPYGPALLCAACIVMAGWMLMRFSYAWEINLDDLPRSTAPGEGAFVRVRGTIEKHQSFNKHYYRFMITAKEDKQVWVFLPRGEVRDDEGAAAVVEGRIWNENFRGMFGLGIYGDVLDTSASRFHAASVAGLVVAAMGCFIFGLYFRAWLRERRAAA